MGEAAIVTEDIRAGNYLLLPFGTPLQLEVDGVWIRLKTTCVGYVPDKCLIVRHPAIASVETKLVKGNRVRVRYESDGEVFGFESELLDTTDAPERLLFIRYPRTFEHVSMRRSKRVDCYLPAELSIDEMVAGKPRDLVFGGVIEDMSKQGCRFTASRERGSQLLPDVRIEQKVTLRFLLPGMAEPVTVTGQAKRTNRDSQKVDIGVEFKEIASAAQEKIAGYLLTGEKVEQ